MLEKLAKLIDVKSLVTLALCAAFIFLSVTGKISGEQFLTVWTLCISFYFGTQAQKKAGE